MLIIISQNVNVVCLYLCKEQTEIKLVNESLLINTSTNIKFNLKLHLCKYMRILNVNWLAEL